jgi:signal transduction histidine kinase
MKQARTIRFRLLLVLLQVFVLIAVLALVSLWRLTDYHRSAGDIHDRYLPATQYLGSLSTLTSEFRAFEAAALLSMGETERQSDKLELEKIDSRIADELAAYDELPSLEALQPFYLAFTEKWQNYRAIADRTLALAETNPAAAASVFRGVSSEAYGAAADALWVLNEHNRLAAVAASRRTEVSYEQALWLSSAGILLGGLILLGGTIHIRRSILLPLARLAAAMRQLAANDMEISLLESDREDEIGEMAQAVEVFRQNALALNEKLAQEQKLAEMQRNFVAMASHEFRTPLTVIDGHAQRLVNRQDKVDGTEVAERAGKVRQAVTRMTGVIDSLIDSIRLIDAPDARFSRFDLDKLLVEVCQFHREMAPRAQIVDKIAAAPLTMTGDPKLLFQLFSNILSNAAKYSPDGGTIELVADRRDGRLAVSIADQGVGIPAEDRDRLFERYFRGSNVTGTVGTGIGLHLVRIILDLHGGEIAVESREGEGARFTVFLPIAAMSPSIGGPAAAEE